ncbi:RNA polymerase sigma-70 factor, ECF subfamily [Ekhidna lutea]|uniref:RNA polymerase sigma factor n=1 Tax=Ekhidna lutea TaxID=447679 RepID=A0A239K253_EKHLU|nr:RNA polymerase sigma factor [Ekhidna lutea]SNT11762.1 RNA polymerase sigma-70 factor, ECF subfamily [Ekhidna lutea]
MKATTVNIHADLIARCRDDDRAAQFEIYNLYNKAMFNTALRITGDMDDAEDVLQEAFVSAFQKLDSYREDASFGAWLKRIVINKALNHVQKVKKDLMLVEDIKEEASEYEPEKTEPNYSVDQIKNAIKLLPSGFRTVLSLYLFEGYDHKEISEILGVTESTSKSQYKRAKDKLKMIVTQEVNYG